MNAWDKSQQLIKFGRNTYQDQLENFVTDGKVTKGDKKKKVNTTMCLCHQQLLIKQNHLEFGTHLEGCSMPGAVSVCSTATKHFSGAFHRI